MIASALVVGGGIVGLAAARALALKGVSVTLFERKPQIADEGGIGIGLQSNALTALAEISVAQHCVDAGVAVARLHTYSPDGKLVGSRPTEKYCGSPWPGYVGISRAVLHRLLVDAAAEAGVTLLTGAEVARVHSDADQAQVELTDKREFSADIAVCADGIYSRTRASLFPAFARAHPTGEVVWRALVPGVRKEDVSFVFGGGVGTIGYTPLGDDLYLYVVDRAERAPPRDATDLADRLAELIKDYGGHVRDLARGISRRPGDVTCRRIESVLVAPRWFEGRVILIGDAAHAGPPTLAQGAAMGIEDAVVLAQVLAGEPDLDMALPLFMQRRFARVKAIVEASLTISRAQLETNGEVAIASAHRLAAQALSMPF